MPLRDDIKITAAMNGKMIRDILQYDLSLSTTCIKSLKYEGKITLNGEGITVRKIAHIGDTLTLEYPDRGSGKTVPCDLPLDIIYDDDYLLCANKPFGMPTHPGANHRFDTLANAVMHRYESRFPFRAVTRLDCDTTGVVLVAKDARTCKTMCDAAADGRLKKSYLAVCVGTPLQREEGEEGEGEGEGEIDAPIGRAEGSIIKRCVCDGGKRAVTRYTVLSEHNGLSLLRVCPVTGRTHQIRVHLSYIGCPIYGDFLYGEEISGVRTLLHCESLEFLHPATGDKIKVEAAMPEDMRSLLES